MHSADRGDTMNDFVPVTEEEAMRIVDRIRREFGVSGLSAWARSSWHDQIALMIFWR